MSSVSWLRVPCDLLLCSITALITLWLQEIYYQISLLQYSFRGRDWITSWWDSKKSLLFCCKFLYLWSSSLCSHSFTFLKVQVLLCRQSSLCCTKPKQWEQGWHWSGVMCSYSHHYELATFCFQNLNVMIKLSWQPQSLKFFFPSFGFEWMCHVHFDNVCLFLGTAFCKSSMPAFSHRFWSCALYSCLLRFQLESSK